ncbi:hypothetical protein AAC387_Pa10g1873 [Persea americana]
MHRRHHPGKPALIDWYLLLQVDEDAGIEVIRRRYRQLGLLTCHIFAKITRPNAPSKPLALTADN